LEKGRKVEDIVVDNFFSYKPVRMESRRIVLEPSVSMPKKDLVFSTTLKFCVH